ncbi:MAG: MFS transporter [Deltaproteobacteria bacterium]|nr:MAG: MFS transporter [Deltaproteobacteria bacterium]
MKGKRAAYFSLFFAIFNAMLGVGVVAPLLPLYAQGLGASGFLIGLAFGIFSLTRTVFLPFVGRASDRFGKKPFIAYGLLFFALAYAGYLLSRDIRALILARGLQGIAAAFVVPAVLSYIGELSPAGKEGTYMGAFNLFFFGGLAAGPFLGGGIKDLWGIRASFLTVGLFSLLGFVLTLLFLPRGKKATLRGGGPFPWKETLGEPSLWGIYLLRFSFSLGIGLTWTFLPLFADGALGLDSSQIGLIISLNILVVTLLQTPIGMLADRTGRSGWVVAGGVMTAVSLFLLPRSRDFTGLFLVNLLLGASGGLAIPSLMAIMVEEGRKLGGMGTLMSIVITFHSIGMFIGPVLGGMVADVMRLQAVFLVGALSALFGVSCFLYLYYMRRRGWRSGP